MLNDVEEIKNALRIIDAKYISSEIKDELIIIRFTYKNRNYLLNIVSKYKLMILEQIESCLENKIEDTTLGLLEDIRIIKSYMSFSDYYIMSTSINVIREKSESLKRMQLTVDNDIVMNISNKNVDNEEIVEVGLIEYDFGLNTFDSRIFEENWLEDFNKKICAYSLKDIFIIYSTLISYFSKVIKETWEGDIIDPFVISHALEVILNELHNRNEDAILWYNEYDSYFSDVGIENYLNNKQKRKELN